MASAGKNLSPEFPLTIKRRMTPVEVLSILAMKKKEVGFTVRMETEMFHQLVGWFQFEETRLGQFGHLIRSLNGLNIVPAQLVKAFNANSPLKENEETMNWYRTSLEAILVNRKSMDVDYHRTMLAREVEAVRKMFAELEEDFVADFESIRSTSLSMGSEIDQVFNNPLFGCIPR